MVRNYRSNVLQAPITIAGYGRASKNKKVRSACYNLFSIINESNHNLIEQYLEFEQKNPQLTPMEIIKQLAKKDQIAPISLAAYGRCSKNKKVKSICIKIYSEIAEQKYNITQRYIRFEKEDPVLIPLEIIEQIAKECNIAPITLAGYGRSSKDKHVKSEAIRVYNNLCDVGSQSVGA